MNGTKNGGSFADQVRRFRARFVQSAGASLGKVITDHVLKAAVFEEAGYWRERLYGPLTTVVLFIEQVLGADHSCQGGGGSRLERSRGAWASAMQPEHRSLLQGTTAIGRGSRRTPGARGWNAVDGGAAGAVAVARS